MRKWLRDVILRSAELIKEREAQIAPSPVNIANGAKCQFCDEREDLFEVSTEQVTMYVCDEHIGPCVSIWNSKAHEFSVVRL